MGAWNAVKHEDDMNDINGTWVFKCKHFPNGTVKKFKASFCACEYQQLEVIDFFETYAPVVQWNTVSLVIFLENLLGLKSKQAKVIAAFLHASLQEDEKVFVRMPLDFNQMESLRFFISRKLVMVCINVCVLSGDISQRNLVIVACLKLLLKSSLIFDMLMIWSLNKKWKWYCWVSYSVAC